MVPVPGIGLAIRGMGEGEVGDFAEASRPEARRRGDPQHRKK